MESRININRNKEGKGHGRAGAAAFITKMWGAEGRMAAGDSLSSVLGSRDRRAGGQ